MHTHVYVIPVGSQRSNLHTHAVAACVQRLRHSSYYRPSDRNAQPRCRSLVHARHTRRACVSYVILVLNAHVRIARTRDTHCTLCIHCYSLRGSLSARAGAHAHVPHASRPRTYTMRRAHTRATPRVDPSEGVSRAIGRRACSACKMARTDALSHAWHLVLPHVLNAHVLMHARDTHISNLCIHASWFA